MSDAPWIKIAEAHIRRAAQIAAENGTPKESFITACKIAWDEDEGGRMLNEYNRLRQEGKVGHA